MGSKYYTGVGSRETPEYISKLMIQISSKLNQLGYTLRSGGADGADSAFYSKLHKSEIFLPWKNFNNSNSDLYLDTLDDTQTAEKLASEIHPAWSTLSSGAKKLHTRNIYQVLGKTLNEPSKFLICWAKVDRQGNPKGGTRTAWMIAKRYNVPCFNLIFETDLKRLENFIK